MKDGSKTTEFWWGIVSSIGLALTGIAQNNETVAVICFIGSAAIPVVYTIGRFLLKLEEKKIINILSDDKEALLEDVLTRLNQTVKEEE